MGWVWYVTCMGEMRSSQKILVGKLEGMRQIGRPRRRWDNFKEALKEYYFRPLTGLVWLKIGSNGRLL
jgi:hypothetical protein